MAGRGPGSCLGTEEERPGRTVRAATWRAPIALLLLMTFGIA